MTAHNISSSSIRSRSANAGKGPLSLSKDAKDKKPANRRQLEQHEMTIRTAIRNGVLIDVYLLDGSCMEDSKPVGFDRYSICVDYEGRRETIFKSAITRISVPLEA